MEDETKKMGEIKGKEAEKTEQKAEEEKTKNAIEEAREIADRIERGNEEAAEYLARIERLRTEEILSGRTDAGQLPEKKKEVSNEEYAKKALEGEFNEK